jgi:hypothetical protein
MRHRDDTPPTVEFYIEELMLDGLQGLGDLSETLHDELTRAMEEALTRHFAEAGTPAALGSTGGIANLDGGILEAPAGTTPTKLGAEIGAAVYHGLAGRGEW